jgi:hypothetical protein
MKQHNLQLALATVFATSLSSASAAPVNYEMSLHTYSGMGAGGASGMLGMMLGKGGGVSKQMDLRLTNPADIPSDYSAEHVVPEAMHIGPTLPLKGERRGKGGSGTESAEQPEGKVLIYWGCSATVAKGQPEVIDFKAMSNRVPPEVAAMARQSRQRKSGGDSGDSLPPRTLWWPYGDAGNTSVPDDASTVGEHVVKASFMQQEIRYTLDKDMDFLEPMNLKAASSDLKAAIPLNWDKLSRAKGYNLNAVGATSDKEMVIWMAAKNKHPMLPGSQNNCTIPAGIFQKSQGAMAAGEAIGPTKGFAYPPQKPGEKKPLIWTAKVRANGYDNVMLGMGDMAKDAAGDAAADSVVPGGGSIIKSLKGLFGN